MYLELYRYIEIVQLSIVISNRIISGISYMSIFLYPMHGVHGLVTTQAPNGCRLLRRWGILQRNGRFLENCPDTGGTPYMVI